MKLFTSKNKKTLNSLDSQIFIQGIKRNKLNLTPGKNIYSKFQKYVIDGQDVIFKDKLRSGDVLEIDILKVLMVYEGSRNKNIESYFTLDNGMGMIYLPAENNTVNRISLNGLSQVCNSNNTDDYDYDITGNYINYTPVLELGDCLLINFTHTMTV